MAAKWRICVSVVSNEFLTLAINSPSTSAANTDSMPVASLIASCDSARTMRLGQATAEPHPEQRPGRARSHSTIEAIVSDDMRRDSAGDLVN